MSLKSKTALSVRRLVPTDQAFLWEALHTALWDPPPAALRPRTVLDHPEVRIYAENWGREGDLGFIGEVGKGSTPAGAVWTRRLKGGQGLAYLDDKTPQLGIAILPAFRRCGYGGLLLGTLLDTLTAQGTLQVALTVHPQNPAIALYERFGFWTLSLRGSYFLMVKVLD